MIHIGKQFSNKHLKCTSAIYDQMNYKCSYQHTKNKHVAAILLRRRITLKHYLLLYPYLKQRYNKNLKCTNSACKKLNKTYARNVVCHCLTEPCFDNKFLTLVYFFKT